MKAKKANSTIILSVGIFLFGAIADGVAAEPASKLLMDFSDASVARQWQSVNDGVTPMSMGSTWNSMIVPWAWEPTSVLTSPRLSGLDTIAESAFKYLYQ